MLVEFIEKQDATTLRYIILAIRKFISLDLGKWIVTLQTHNNDDTTEYMMKIHNAVDNSYGHSGISHRIVMKQLKLIVSNNELLRKLLVLIDNIPLDDTLMKVMNIRKLLSMYNNVDIYVMMDKIDSIDNMLKNKLLEKLQEKSREKLPEELLMEELLMTTHYKIH